MTAIAGAGIKDKELIILTMHVALAALVMQHRLLQVLTFRGTGHHLHHTLIAFAFP